MTELVLSTNQMNTMKIYLKSTVLKDGMHHHPPAAAVPWFPEQEQIQCAKSGNVSANLFTESDK